MLSLNSVHKLALAVFLLCFILHLLFPANCRCFQTVMPWPLPLSNDRITDNGKLQGDDCENMRRLCNVLYGALIQGGL